MGQSTCLKWGSVAFGIFWVVFMAFWTTDGSPPHLAILAVSGVTVAACWYWAMNRFTALDVPVARRSGPR